MEVVDAADEAGSTDDTSAGRSPVRRSPRRSRSELRSTSCGDWPRSSRSTKIFCLDPVVCPCSTMYRIHPGYLAWVLEELVAGRVVNQISVTSDVADPARIALERMLAAKPRA